MRTAIILIIALIVGWLGFEFWNETKISTIENCKILELQQQQLIKGTGHDMTTKIRYLVVTDKETFVCENSIVNGKFNNSDIFWRLKKDSVYTLKVAGIGKTFFTDYKNILEYNK